VTEQQIIELAEKHGIGIYPTEWRIEDVGDGMSRFIRTKLTPPHIAGQRVIDFAKELLSGGNI